MGGGTKRDPTGAKGAIGDEAKAPVGLVGVQLIPREDDSETIRCAQRGALVEVFTHAMESPTLVGDLVLARIVAQLLLRILGSEC